MRTVFVFAVLLFCVGIFIPNNAHACDDMPHHVSVQQEKALQNVQQDKSCCSEICLCDVAPCASCSTIIPQNILHHMAVWQMADFSALSSDRILLDMVWRLERPPRV